MRSKQLAGVLCLVLSFVAPACDDDDDNGTGATGTNAFTAVLTGANEVPSVTSAATGTATININGSTVDYRIEVQGITDVIGGHIHSGAAGVSGPVRVTLVPSPYPGVTNGVLSEGTFSASDVSGITYDELLNEIRTGMAYVNVHTTANPGGEIRGQIVVR